MALLVPRVAVDTRPIVCSVERSAWLSVTVTVRSCVDDGQIGQERRRVPALADVDAIDARGYGRAEIRRSHRSRSPSSSAR